MAAGAAPLGLASTVPGGPGVIDEQLIAEIAARVSPPIATFRLSARQDADAIAAQHTVCQTSITQLVDAVHLPELEKLRNRTPGIKPVQVIHVENERALEEARRVESFVDALVLDPGNSSRPMKELGGTGRSHDWQISRRTWVQVRVPVFLTAGLNADNVAAAIAMVRSFGVDLCSGIRTGGALDASKLDSFMHAVRGSGS